MRPVGKTTKQTSAELRFTGMLHNQASGLSLIEPAFLCVEELSIGFVGQILRVLLFKINLMCLKMRSEVNIETTNTAQIQLTKHCVLFGRHL